VRSRVQLRTSLMCGRMDNATYASDRPRMIRWRRRSNAMGGMRMFSTCRDEFYIEQTCSSITSIPPSLSSWIVWMYILDWCHLFWQLTAAMIRTANAPPPGLPRGAFVALACTLSIGPPVNPLLSVFRRALLHPPCQLPDCQNKPMGP
jgi:hypothetical protein